ncbi:MAG TPA: Ig-like domain repeat protein [Terracidiphilus sp.]|nr:Ig-like domain repeat protein [Terracidiphilus sp.]
MTILVLTCTAQSFASQGQQKLHKHVPPVVANGQAKRVGPLPPSQAIDMTVVLPLRNQTALTNLLGELYDPSSPNYRHFLTVQEFTDQFGPTEQDYGTVMQWAKDHGLTVVSQSKNRITLDLRGSVAQVSTVLGVAMNTYRDPNGKRTFFSIDRDPTLDLSVPIKHIEGLNNYSVPQPMLKRKKNASPIANVLGSGPGGYYLGSDMRAAYYGGTLLTGTGQSVGLLEFDGYRLSDVDLTFNNAGQSYSVPINNVLLDGTTGAAGSDDAEEVLDIVQAIGMAPGLNQVRVYIGTSDADILNSMASEDICQELSVSWSWVPDDPATDDGIFQEFATQGQSIFVASGDQGAYDAAISPYFYPAEDVYVTAVGGTHLITNYGGGPWAGESAWNSDGYGSGGGVSPDGIPLPSWQQGAANWPNGGSNSLRNVPDVAMEGDLDNFFCDLGFCAGGEGGTSFAAPRWAGFMALINQQAVETGSAPAGGLGFLNPTIYSIGEGANFNADLHDVTDGNNDTADQLVWYNAVSGYDLVSGWGSPNGQNLIDALAGPVVPGFWLSSSPSSLPISQGGSATATISVIDAGGFSGAVNLTASGLPGGVTASFNPTSTTGTSVLTLTADGSATTGAATVTITGISGTLTAKTQLDLNINPPLTPPPPVEEFGAVNIGSKGNAVALTFTITTAATLQNIGVLTQGSPNLDFVDAGGDTCATGKRYKAGTTCTVNVAFSPKYPGTRDGAVILSDKYGNSLANSVYLQGVGVGPQSTFNPGSETTIGSSFASPDSVAIRGDGSIYVADYGNSTTHGGLYLETFANGSYTQTQLNCTFNSPTGVAVDGSGTLYVSDPGTYAVYRVAISNDNCTQTAIGIGFNQPSAVAVDGNGNIYITDKGNHAVYKEALQNDGTYVQTMVGSGWITPLGVAVDGNGRIYVADSGIPGVVMETPSGGNYTQALIAKGWTAPSGVAVDSVGNIYISDVGNALYKGGLVTAGVYRAAASGANYAQTPIGTGWTEPSGLAVDAMGNVVVADQLRGIYKEDLADPPRLTFANAATDTISADSPKIVTVSNLGTAALNVSAVSYPTDFPEASAGSTECTSSTSLNAGQTCDLSIEFEPTTSLAGNTSLLLSESVSITTNTLNAAAAQQTLSATGTEVLPGGSVNLDVSADPATVGSSITFTAKVNGSSGGPVPTGTVTFYNGTTALSGAISLTNAVATYFTASLAAGTYTISASYSGDSNYVSLNSDTINESILATPGTAPFGNTNAGTLSIGSTSSPIPLTITFTQAVTLGNISVLTENAPNLDFSNAGTGTCTVGNAYTANSTCTVNVTFSPKYPGERYGAVELYDNNSNVIGTGYLQGKGVGPQTSFPPGTITPLYDCAPCYPLMLAYPQGIAVDASGNFDFATRNGFWGIGGINTGSVISSAIGSGFTDPNGIAVDAAGNVYLADRDSHMVYKENPKGSYPYPVTYIQTPIGYGLNSPAGIAVDGFGNVYIADFGNGVSPGAVYAEVLSDGSYTQTKIAGTFVSPKAVAVDGNGDVFVADSANGNGKAAIYKLTPSNGTYIQSSIGYGWITPTGIAVDGNGNVFVTDNDYDLGDGFVAEETLQPDGSYTQSIIVDSTSIPEPSGIALDSSGNRYITDDLEGEIFRQDIGDPPSLSFAATQYDQTSSDSPKTVTIQNIGNADLTFTSVSYPTDFPEASGLLSDCATQSSLQAGSGCTLTINFEPGSPLSNGQSQSLTENVTIATNSLGSSTQNIALAGTEVTPAATVTLTAAANVFVAGGTATFTATVTGKSGLPSPTGTVTFYSENQFTHTYPDPTTAMGTATLSSNGTATFSTNSLAVGIYGISATYSGDQTYSSVTSSLFVVKINAASGFGTQNVGSSGIMPVTISFTSDTTLGGIAVLTDGMQNLDFTNAGGGTCAIGNLYPSNSSCTVNVSFAPRFAGARRGALLLSDTSGNLLQTIYLDGKGIGPQVDFKPAATTTAFVETSAPCDQVVDSSGDIYVSLFANGRCGPITKWTPINGSYVQSTVPSGTLSGQITLAVDGAGNVYIADTNNNRVLKETLFNGVYSETVVGTGLSLPRQINVDGHGNIYFFDNDSQYYAGPDYYYPSIYIETPSPAGGYIQATLVAGSMLLNHTSETATGLKVNDEGYMYVVLEGPLQGVLSDSVICIAPGTVYSTETYFGNVWLTNITLGYVDANGDPYITDPYYGSFLYVQNGDGYLTKIPMPAGAWGIDGSGNLYRTVDNVVTKVNYASPPSLRFAQTVVGSKSSDSPQTATLENFGNAPLIFSVPSSGTNPSVSNNFALDPSSTCPQISVSGSSSSLAMNNSCTYAVNFTPTASGTISGSVIASDNALNAVGGTQTIPLSGSGTSGTSGNIALVMLTKGPDGALHGTVETNPFGIGQLYANVWVDTTHKTFVQGGVFMQLDSQGNLTCTAYSSPTQVTATQWTPVGTFDYTTEQYYIPGCGQQLYNFAVARYTWGSSRSIEQVPFILEYSTQDNRYSNGQQFVAQFAPVTVGPALPGESGSNSLITATATLTNPPVNAVGYDWQIVGGNGAILFPNGQETMSSTTNSIPIEELNPTQTSIPFDIEVGVRNSETSSTFTSAASDPLLYGPGTGSFSYSAKDNGDCSSNQGECTQGDPINIGTGNVFEKVVDYQTAGQNKLSYIRYYNSFPIPNTFATTLGLRWRSNYDRYLNFVSSSEIAAERPDGQEITFHQSGSSWVSDSDIDDTLTQSGTTWTLKDHDDTVETYTKLSSGEGQLQSIALRNGYTQTMAYNASGQLSTVTDSYNRQLTFTYSNGTIATVTTPDGLVLTYGYNSVSNPNDRLASVSYSTSPVTEQQYQYQDSSVPYALTGIMDENGNLYESWTYDSDGRALTNQVGGVANKFTVAYDDANLTRTVTNALGETETYTFTMMQGVPKVAQITRTSIGNVPTGTETFAYDTNGFLSSETDWDGNLTTYQNDSHGDPLTITEGAYTSVARTTTITYDQTWGHLPDSIATPGLTTSFTYDSNGEVLTKTLADTTTQSIPYSTQGATRTWTYTWQNSLLASVQSPRTDVVEKTSYAYDSTGALTGITNPLNQQTTITSHTGGGLPLTVVDPNGVSTTLNYDPRQRLLSSTTASHETQYGYDAAENLTSVTQPDGSGLTYTYDSAHRLTGMKDLFGQKISYTLDALGDPTATDVLNASGTVTSKHSNAFDILGRMGQDIGAAGQTSSFTYDSVGNMLTATDQASNKTQRAFDALNRLTRITDPESGVTTTSYDAHDRPLSVVSPTGGTTAYVYDGFGDLIQESSPNTGTAVYYYDSTGNMIKRVAATGAVTQYTYDALDRVLTMTFPADSPENVTYTYDQSGHGDGIGRLTSVTDAAGTLSLSYDQFGNLLTNTRTTSAGTLTTSYTYDAANRIASITYPSQTVVSYTRDIMGRITAVTAKPNGGASTPVATNVAYEPFGPSNGLTYGNGVSETRGFDQDYRMTGITDTGASVLQNLGYAYYPTNNVQTITDAVNSGNSQSFSYDNLQRLSSAAGGYGAFSYTYDKDGNRLTQTQGTETTTYGFGTASDLLATLSVGGTQTQAVGYSADGRIATLSPGIQAPGGQSITSLSYNQDGRLSAVNASGGALASYTYNAFGQRLIKTISGTTGEIYQYGQDGMLLEETNASGAAQADYIYLNGRPIATLNNATGALYFLQDDMLGTPQLATDSSQTVAWQATYQPFGTASASGTITQNLRFPGQYFDAESGWNHNGFRDYIPDLGRYAEPDPLAMQGSARFYNPTTGALFTLRAIALDNGATPYVYGYDSPTNYTDPEGLISCKKSCDELLEEINKLSKKTFQRFLEYQYPKWNLPLLGKMSRQSHIAEFKRTQDRLRKALNDYNSQGCPGSGVPAGVWQLATMPAPALTPSPSDLPHWKQPYLPTPAPVVGAGTAGGEIITIIVIISLSPVGA